MFYLRSTYLSDGFDLSDGGEWECLFIPFSLVKCFLLQYFGEEENRLYGIAAMSF